MEGIGKVPIKVLLVHAISMSHKFFRSCGFFINPLRPILVFFLVGGLGAEGASGGEMREVLLGLGSLSGIAGYEEPVAAYIRSALPWRWAVHSDNLGNVWTSIGEGSPHLLFAAPLDEVGYVVSGIEEDGYLRLNRVSRGLVGPLFDQFHEGQRVTVFGQGGPVPGVVACLSTHLWRGRPARTTAFSLEDAYVDVGARSAQQVEEQGIRLLSQVTLEKSVTLLGKGGFAGPALGNRALAAVLLVAAREFQRQRPLSKLTFCWYTQSAFGHRGLERLSENLEADWIFVLRSDVGVRPEQGGRFQLDPEIRVGTGLRFSPAAAAREAQSLGVRAQPAAFPEWPGTQLAWPAGRIVQVGLPVDYPLTSVETVHEDDLESLLTWIMGLAGFKGPVGRHAAVKTVALPPRAGPETPEEILTRLVETPGVSGREDEVRQAIRSLLPPWAMASNDRKGNLSVSFGQGSAHLAFVAHMDEVGFEVSAIEGDGRLRLKRLGGFIESLFEAHPVRIHTSSGTVEGIVAPRTGYGTAGQGSISSEELRVQVGAGNREEVDALGIRVGDRVSIPKRFVRLAGQRANGRSFDDRVGSAALVAALRRLDPARLTSRITFAWTVEEEIGLVGAQELAKSLKPDVVFAVDTFVSSDSPRETERFAYAPLGNGAVLRAIDNSNVAPPGEVARILRLARDARVALQYGNTAGGNDGSMFVRYRAADVPIAFPLRYSHSPAEVIDLADFHSLIDLVVLLCEKYMQAP